jgi:hypothetical protein
MAEIKELGTLPGSCSVRSLSGTESRLPDIKPLRGT